MVYVDDLLIISEHPNKYMDQVKDSFFLKPDSIKTPDKYLGADISRRSRNSNELYWAMGSNQYIKEAVKIGVHVLLVQH